jgi:hypothetical protein
MYLHKLSYARPEQQKFHKVRKKQAQHEELLDEIIRPGNSYWKSQ